MYIEVKWLKIKEAKGCNDVLFKLLERTLPKSFFEGKLKLNPSKDPPPKNFVEVLKQWVSKRNPISSKAPKLDNYYKCFEICDMSDLREVLSSTL